MVITFARIMLELPPTIRLLEVSELPDNPVAHERLNSARTAVIEQGFLLKPVTDPSLPFEFFAVININNSRLWELFSSLVEQLPDEVSCRYGKYEDDLVYSEYMPRHGVMEILERFRNEIARDCNLQLGVVNNSEDTLLEVFISEVKYLSVWGMDEKGFLQIMEEFELNHVPEMRFMDEFPTVVIPLSRIDPKSRPAADVVSSLNASFKKLHAQSSGVAGEQTE